MRFSAWVNAVPEKQEESRLDVFIEQGEDVIWPEVSAMYLVHYLMEIGPCSSNGMGLIPVSWQEIQAWQEQQGLSLNAWELKIIRMASGAYANQANISSKPDCPPPDKVIEKDPLKLAKHIKDILRG